MFLFHIKHVSDFQKNLKHDFANKMHPRPITKVQLLFYFIDISIPDLESLMLLMPITNKVCESHSCPCGGWCVNHTPVHVEVGLWITLLSMWRLVCE